MSGPSVDVLELLLADLYELPLAVTEMVNIGNAPAPIWPEDRLGLFATQVHK